jgi:predicted transposase YdaD
MLRYFTDIRLSHPNANVCQYLLYIGKPRLSMANGISTEQFHYRYQMLDMQQMDYQFFIQQNSADALVLAVLCDFKELEPRAAVHEILTRLIAIQQDDAKGLREYVSMLEILATNRDLNINIKQEFKMLEIEIEQLPSFLIGEERGIKKGIKKGLKQGIEKGIEKGIEQGAHHKAVAIAKQLLNLMSPVEVARITGLTVAEVENINQSDK